MLPLTMHCAQGDVHVKLLDLAYVPGLRFNLSPFSLYAVMLKCSVTLDADGAHVLDGRLSFVPRDTWSYIEAIRVITTVVRSLPPDWSREKLVAWIFTTFMFPAHYNTETLRETAPQMGAKVAGELVPCAGCSEAERKRMAVPWTATCRWAKPLGRLFVDLWGRDPGRPVMRDIC